MNITAVESSTLAAIAYDRTRELLQLEFQSRTLYRYFGVPAPLYEELLRASSKGKYFNQAIRGKFPYRRISNGPAEAQEQNRAVTRRR